MQLIKNFISILLQENTGLRLKYLSPMLRKRLMACRSTKTEQLAIFIEQKAAAPIFWILSMTNMPILNNIFSYQQ
ncbi:hypothetical protein AXK12_04200 [Cephaloticoccus capnophilus]|uniref:Uncharacterized protein n=1 Tax=Cephaloticoccus capnophilus TaxID=1548208 RepID=A0A139SNG8_9BACT|nr:hypothetical protein AXK12_04200 [Cephaloticoccus capnophilus]